MENIFRGILGVALLVGFCYLLSNCRKKVNWRLVLGGIGLQVFLAFFLLRTDAGVGIKLVSTGFITLLEFSDQGARFMFGELLDYKYGFAFKVLPTIIFVSAITSLLYYLGILQWIVFGFAWVMKRLMRLSGAESLSAAANVFVGQTEAPLVIKPYIAGMTRSELMAMMTGGMATIAGSVFVLYIATLAGDDEVLKIEVAVKLLTASMMNAPAAMLVAKMLVPEQETFSEELFISKEKQGRNVLDALANGTTQGLKLALNVAAMIIVFVALVAMVNAIFGWIGGIGGNGKGWLNDLIGGNGNGWLNDLIAHLSGGVFSAFSLEAVAGFLFSPFAWVIGGNTGDLLELGQLFGTKMVTNEFLAYIQLGEMQTSGDLSPRSVFLATFALCGFANFSSIGIQIGGIGSLAPERRADLAALGFKAMIGGTIASFLTASIAGMFF